MLDDVALTLAKRVVTEDPLEHTGRFTHGGESTEHH
jgi:hypothetical protein